MQQSRLSSLIETVVNNATGFLIAVLTQAFIFPLFGINVPLSTNIKLVVIFTGFSVIRGYCIRRLFNSSPWRRFKESELNESSERT